MKHFLGLVLAIGVAASLAVHPLLLGTVAALADPPVSINITGLVTGTAISNFLPVPPSGSITFQAGCNTATGAPGSGSFSGTLGGVSVSGTFSITLCGFISLPLSSCSLAAETGAGGFVDSGTFMGQEMDAFGCIGSGHSNQLGLIIGPPAGCLGFPICASYLGFGTGTVHHS